MATDLDRISSLQALADSTCLIYDRAITPEKIVGQAWLISKARVVTLASSVANYIEAPWALTIRFPHPDIVYGARTITMHPDFNRREARDHYLAQNLSGPSPFIFENDIATIALESDLTPPAPEKLSELNRALSLPFEISPQDMSGSMRPGDASAILQSALSTGRSGLISIVDGRNIPFARIAIRQARIVKASFNSLYNELAICELLWRKPGGNFAFQPLDTFHWPADVPDITTSTDQIIAESIRRMEEIPRIIENLGGPDVRFARATQLADFSSINPSERWIAERLWEALDGYLPLSKIPDRVGADSYGCLKMVYDFATMGLINSPGNKAFHENGQLGPMMVPAQDLDIKTWDPLTAFYLDPISGAPNLKHGNFFGSANLLNTKKLLHTIALPYSGQSAAVLKDGKLVGIHTGSYAIRLTNAPPFALQQMMWIGALNDLGTKRLRTAEASVDELDDEPVPEPVVSQKLTGLRSRSNSGGSADSVSPPSPPQEEETGPLAKFSKGQIAGVSAAVFAIGLVMMLSGLFSPHPTPDATTANNTTPQPVAAPPEPAKPAVVNPELGDLEALKIAGQIAGFQGAPPSGFVYKDTTKTTDPKPSFGLESEYKNLKLLFVEWPNALPYQNINPFMAKLPFLNYIRMSNDANEFSGRTENTGYAAGHYRTDKPGEAPLCAVGAFMGTNPAHSILFIATPLTGDSMADVSAPSRIVEELMSARNKKQIAADSNESATDSQTALATPEQLTAYRNKLQASIKSNFRPPQAEDGADTRVGLAFSVDASGNVSDLVRKPSNPNDDFNKALQKALDAAKPLAAPPKTKSGKYSMLLKAGDGELTLIEQ